MRIDSAAYVATRAPEEDTDLAVLPDASGQSQTQAETQSTPTPPAEESSTLAVMARDSARLARYFEREPSPRMAYRPVARAAAAVLEPAQPRIAAASTPVANPPASAPATPTAMAPAAAGAPTSYTGERPVDPQWLADREKSLVAIRADYTAARTQAQATAGTGPGWTVAATVTDESGQIRSANGRELVFVADPNAPQVVAGYDESGPIYKPAGQWMEFNEEAFAAHYRAQGGANLQSLASLYGTDAAGLFAKHPELWGIATSDHAINAGPAPAGRAMGDPAQLGMLDLYMQDPQMSALIDAYGGQPATATSDIAREQVRIYGQQRYDQLSRLDNAMESVRNQYSEAMAQAQASGSGPGWVERARTVTVSDESGQTRTQTLYVTDESGQPLRDASGQPQAQMERIFDPDAFTAWYAQQGGLQHKAFASFYGKSHTTYATDESGRTFASSITFDNPNWSMYGAGGQMGHKDLIGINPNDPPRLHNRDAVGFDLEAGWATAHGNIKQKRDWFETVVQVAMVAVVSYVSAGTLGPAAAGALGMTTTTAAGATVLTAAGTVVSAAVAGAATSAVSGMMSGNLSFKGILQGALAGGLSAGLMTQFGQMAAAAGPIGTIALRTTVQGGIQALLGGKFKDGALAGFAGSLADLASVNMQASIDKAIAEGTMTATQAASARVFARVMGSAIRAAGNPDDPANAFASSFLNEALQQLDTRPTTGSEGGGNSTPDAAAVAEPLSPVYGSTFAEDVAIRKVLDDPYGYLDGQSSSTDEISRVTEFDPDQAWERWDQTGEKPVYDFGDPLTVGGDELAAGPRSPRAGGRTPTEMSVNRRSADLLDVLSDVDAIGLVPDAYRDIKQLAPLMAEASRQDALKKIQASLQEQLGPRNMPTPNDLGALPGIGEGPDGRVRTGYDTADLIDRYSDALRKVGLAKQGVIELDYRTFEVKSIGTQKLTPAQYTAEIESRYQRAFSRAVEVGSQYYDQGQLRYPADMPKQLQIGLFADRVAREALVSYNQAIGVPEGPGQVISLNRWAYDMSGSGRYVRPDVLIDLGPGLRSWIDGKTTPMDPSTTTQQFDDFFRFTGATNGKVATPGGVVPISKPAKPGR